MNHNNFKKYTLLAAFIIGFFVFTLQSVFADTTIQTGNVTNSVSIQNKANQNVLTIPCQCTPTPTPFTAVQAVATPTPTTVSSSVAQQVTAPTPTSTSAPASVAIPTQQVLGASTMASTGTFTENIMNILSIIGFGFVAMGLLRKYFFKFF